jgi:hypothetical protein
MENRIKEQKTFLLSDRTSAATMRANQLRLWFSSVAYLLMSALRRLGLKDTDLAKAQCDTIRLKLFKIGARITVTTRKIWISLSSSYPLATLMNQEPGIPSESPTTSTVSAGNPWTRQYDWIGSSQPPSDTGSAPINSPSRL